MVGPSPKFRVENEPTRRRKHRCNNRRLRASNERNSLTRLFMYYIAKNHIKFLGIELATSFIYSKIVYPEPYSHITGVKKLKRKFRDIESSSSLLVSDDSFTERTRNIFYTLRNLYKIYHFL